MKLTAVVLTCVFGLSCVARREPCGPTNCNGCCSPLNDTCVENDPHVCTAPGATCAECDQFQVCLSGTCIRPPFFSGGPATIDFGHVAVGTTSATTLTFNNGGDQILVIRDAGVEPPVEFAGFTVSGDAIQAVKAGQSATIVLTFTPPSNGGFTGQLIFDSNAGDPAYTPFVTGTGI